MTQIEKWQDIPVTAAELIEHANKTADGSGQEYVLLYANGWLCKEDLQKKKWAEYKRLSDVVSGKGVSGMNKLPTLPGFYWAKWKLNDGTIDAMFDTSSPTTLWEVVEVYLRDYGDEPDAMYVWLMGVPGTQPAENFYWGPGPLEKPVSPVFKPDEEKQYAARRRYQNMTHDEREKWLQDYRRKL